MLRTEEKKRKSKEYTATQKSKGKRKVKNVVM